MPRYHESENEDPKYKERPDGTFHCRVSGAVSSTDKNGHEMITLKLIDPSSGETIGVDRLSYNPEYRWITSKKVAVLGLSKGPDGVWDYEAADLVGREAIIHWHNVVDKKNSSRKYYNVNSQAIDTECGYVPVPGGNIPPVENDDVPF